MSLHTWTRLASASSGGDPFVFNLTTSGPTYSILVTDGIDLFEETLGQTEIARRQSELNPAVEANAEDLVEEVRILLSAKTTHIQSDRRGGQEGAGLDVSLQGMLLGYEFKWVFRLGKASSKGMQTSVVSGIASGFSHLLRQQEHLLGLIRAKDLEIFDYEQSGATLSRRALKTEPFKKEELQRVPFDNGRGSLVNILASEEFATLMRSIAVSTMKASGASADGASKESGEVTASARRERIRIRGATYCEEESEDREGERKAKKDRVSVRAMSLSVAQSQSSQMQQPSRKAKVSEESKAMVKKLKKL